MVSMRYSVIGATVQQVQSVGATAVKQGHNIPVIFAELTDDQAARLRTMGATVSLVLKVKADVQTLVAPPVVAPPVPYTSTPLYTPADILGMARFEDVHQMFDPPVYGALSNIAIIDTGIRESHELINGRVVYKKNYTSDPMRDGFDHGTAIASIVVEVAPEVGILNMKVIGDSGEGTEEAVVEAIDDCIDLIETEFCPCVINLSLGAPDDNNPNNVMRIACRAAIEKGIFVVASAGNDGPTPGTISCPACEQYVIAVGSLQFLPDQEAYRVSNFSSRGPTREGIVKPDAAMFGEDMTVASGKSDTAVAAKSGTSFAAPFISGFGVLYVSAMERWMPGMTHRFPGVIPGITEVVSPSEMIDVHLRTFSLRSQENKNNEAGWGVPFGPLVAQAIGAGAAGGISVASIIPVFMVMGMMGLMAKSMKQGKLYRT